jgi:L-gulonolactone oxidase
VGAGHSFSDIGLTDGMLMTLDLMRGVVQVDAAAHLVTVQAGIRLFELVEALARQGLGLSILGSVARQSVAGAISTGTHGSSLPYGNLASSSTACGWSPRMERSSRWIERTSGCLRPGWAWERSG